MKKKKNDTQVLHGSFEEVTCFYSHDDISFKYLHNTKVSLRFDNWINVDLSCLKNTQVLFGLFFFKKT